MSAPAPDKEKATPAATASAIPAKGDAKATNGEKPAGDSTEAKATEGKDKDKEAAPKAPHPLDGLSQAALRQKLDASKKELRGYLDRKKKVDQELVSLDDVPTDCLSYSSFVGEQSDAPVDLALAGHP